MTALLIAGTDTDVGKTFVTIALAAYWQKHRVHKNCNTPSLLSIFKLMQTGTGDVETYNRLFTEIAGIEVIEPLRFDAPVAPPIAALKENREINLGQVWQQFNSVCQQSNLVLLETLGGLGSPVTNELIVGNIAADWYLPAILVVPVKLGAIANAVANVALARSLKINLQGIILNCTQPDAQKDLADLTPIDLIQSLTQVPILGTLPYVSEPTDFDYLAKIVSDWDLEIMLPQGNLMLQR